MFYKAIITILTATLAAAAPSKRQSEPGLQVSLTNTVLAVTEQYSASTDGTPVPVNSTFEFDVATVECVEVCIPEYHCNLYDKAFAPVTVLNPGTTEIEPASQVGLIICGPWLAADTKREVLPETPTAR